MKLIKKLAKAKEDIKQSPIKKEGRNSFSKYDYFTPAQIEGLVSHVCQENGLLTKFDLIRNELGVFGRLTIFDLDSNEDDCIEFNMATAIPDIKATNIAQQLGGCVTYTERYLKMSAFGITDSNLDFDTDKKKVVEELASTTQISIIEGMLNEVNLTDKQLNTIENELSSYTSERATECIEWLKTKAIDRIDSGLGYTQTDIKNKLKQL